jgi:hypothetical protein
MKSDLRGAGRVALPVVFLRDEAGRWCAAWLHLRLTGFTHANQVETNRVAVATLMRGVLGRGYLTVGYLLDVLAERVEVVDAADIGAEAVTFLGFDDPGDLPEGSTVITPRNLGDVIPA